MYNSLEVNFQYSKEQKYEYLIKIKHSLAYLGWEKESDSYTWVYVLMGNLLRGIGESPIQPLGISYLDDFAKEGETSFYMGNVQNNIRFYDYFPWVYH